MIRWLGVGVGLLVGLFERALVLVDEGIAEGRDLAWRAPAALMVFGGFLVVLVLASLGWSLH